LLLRLCGSGGVGKWSCTLGQRSGRGVVRHNVYSEQNQTVGLSVGETQSRMGFEDMKAKSAM
jgi:hypothetical protein